MVNIGGEKIIFGSAVGPDYHSVPKYFDRIYINIQ